MNNQHTTDEFLDLVDDNDNVVGKKKRSEVYSEHLSSFRVINAFLVNSNGKIWIPRRTATKRVFPLCLDMSLGGHVESGESYEDAFGRELMEELNLDVKKIDFHELGKCTPQKHGVSAFMKVYEMKSNSTPDFNKDDFIEYFWLSPQELFQKLDGGDKSKNDLPKLVKIFYK
ncbi:MAG: NUDIX hydrolase [bacterium]|nr:NUDIX hydrolase [bacterium]